MFVLIQTFKNVLRIFIHRSNVLCYSTEFTSNICSLAINHGDKTVSKLYRKYNSIKYNVSRYQHYIYFSFLLMILDSIHNVSHLN